MINIFRKIRYDLMGKNPAGSGASKTGIYLKYAIGEIVLVVIGILIALQINIWNEKRKINNDIKSVFTLLEQELETNIKQSNDFLKYGYYKDSVQTLFNQNKVTREMIKASPYLIGADFGTNTIKFLDDRLIEIIASEKQFPSLYQGLIPELKLLKSRIDEHRFWERKALDFAGRKAEEYVNKFSWSSRVDSLSVEKQIHHALTDSIYRNNINFYAGLQLSENVWYASLMRTSSVALLWQIKQIQGLDKTLTINQFFKELDLKPLSEYACTDKPYKTNEINFRRSLIIYNNTKESITFNYVDDSGKQQSPYTISPNKFLVRVSHNMDNDRFIELTVDDECRKVFKQNKEDYLLFE